MLRELYIENIAVIEKTEICFDNGFNVFTGETGAGKSILIDSINTVLGARINKDLVRFGENKATVTALFDNIGDDVSAICEEMGYPCDDGQIVLSREFTADAKSTCRINAKPATASIVKRLAPLLIDIHGQHDNQSLLKPENHVLFIDSFGSLKALRDDYFKVYSDMKNTASELQTLESDEGEKERRIDLLTYQLNEIDAADLTPGEDDELSSKRRIIKNYSKIFSAVNTASGYLDGSDEFDGITALTENAASELESVADFDESIAKIAARSRELSYELEEINSELKEYIADFEYDDSELEYIEERLDLIYKLKRKYGTDIESVLEYAENCRSELEGLSNSEEKCEALRKKLKELKKLAHDKAAQLADERKKAADRFAKLVCEQLKFLDMPSVVLTVKTHPCELYSNGSETMEFLISANVGEAPRPLSKIASGGEISRIMLAMKNVLSDKDAVQTMIFDEIDTGVSGRAAVKIAEKLRQTAKNKQVICVTHLPQVAAAANHHLLIEKKVYDNRTKTQVRAIYGDERIKEIGRIIGGDNITPAVLKNAAEMIERYNG